MPSASGKTEAPTLLIRVSVPAAGEFRPIATDLSTKIAELVGAPALDAGSAAELIGELTDEVAPDNADDNITYEFHQIRPASAADAGAPAERALRIAARCGVRSSEIRHPLPV